MYKRQVNELLSEENDKYYMYYALKENSLEGMQGLGKGDLTSLRCV